MNEDDFSLKPSFALSLRSLRESMGLSQRDLARLLDVKQVTLSSWENATRIPSEPGNILQEVVALLDIHDQFIDSICEGIEEESDVLDTPFPTIRTFHTDQAFWEASPLAKEKGLPASMHRSAVGWAVRILNEEYGIEAWIVE